jgi:hypothetical protein
MGSFLPVDEVCIAGLLVGGGGNVKKILCSSPLKSFIRQPDWLGSVAKYTDLTLNAVFSTFSTVKEEDNNMKFEWCKLHGLACEEHGDVSKVFHYVLKQQEKKGR